MLECVEVFQDEDVSVVESSHLQWIQASIRTKKRIVHCIESTLDKNLVLVVKEDGTAHMAFFLPQSANPYRVSKPLRLSTNKRGSSKIHSITFHPYLRIIFVLLLNGNIEVSRLLYYSK